MEHTMPYDANLERCIRERAFQIWIEEGQPIGRDREHWLMAEAELVVPDVAAASARSTDR